MERLPLFIEVEHAITSTTYNGHEAVLEVRAMTQLLQKISCDGSADGT